MDSSENKQKRIEEIEAEIEQEISSNQENSNPNPVSVNSFSHGLTTAKHWFQSLPLFGKVLVTFGAISISFSLLTTVFKIVTSLITLVIFAGFIYFVYKFFVKPSSSP
jgi:hypothetical protein